MPLNTSVHSSMRLRRLILMALFIAVGTLANSALSFPVGLTRCAPLQSMINVVAAVYLGPWSAGLIALIIGVLRNLYGTGTIFAFPGGIIGALLAGFLYHYLRRAEWAGIGEIIGTSFLAVLASIPLAWFVLGRTEAAFITFFPGFAVSAVVGGIAGVLLVRSLALAGVKTLTEPAVPAASETTHNKRGDV